MLNIILIDDSIYFHEDMLARIGLRDFCPVNIIASLTDGYDLPFFLSQCQADLVLAYAGVLPTFPADKIINVPVVSYARTKDESEIASEYPFPYLGAGCSTKKLLGFLEHYNTCKKQYENRQGGQ